MQIVAPLSFEMKTEWSYPDRFSDVGSSSGQFDMDHESAASQIIESGKSDVLSAALRAISDMTASGGERKYSDRVSMALGRAICCRNYSKLALQLCHFVNIADACGSGRERYERLFFGISCARGNVFRAFLVDGTAEQGWRRSGFDLTESGVAIKYRDGVFNVPFSRMPLLSALMDFVLTTQSFAALDGVFSEMLNNSTDQVAIANAANAISRQIYRFLNEHLPSVQNMEKFHLILEFLKGRHASDIEISDRDILEFWCEQSGELGGGDFRGYRTVFEAFVDFSRALDAAQDRRAIDDPMVIGNDFERGEIDPGSLTGIVEQIDDWRTPFAVLDESPANRIKFLTGKDRQIISVLIDSGALALAFPLSVLRCDVFGRAQARITQALRRSSSSEEITSLAADASYQDYEQCVDQYQSVQDRLQKTLRAALYALTRNSHTSADDEFAMSMDTDPLGDVDEGGSGAPLEFEARESAMEEARLAYRATSRTGFDDNSLDSPEIVEGFRLGTGSIIEIDSQLKAFLSLLYAVFRNTGDLLGQYENDKALFGTHFQSLYGGQE
jgi:hypothetical protein